MMSPQTTTYPNSTRSTRTYPSVWEGWGNQFIEAVFAKLPVVLFEYPVWVSDLKDAGFDVVSLGDKIAGRGEDGLVRVAPAMVRKAADEVVAILSDPERRTAIGERNFAIGRERYSLETLERIIRGLLGGAGIACGQLAERKVEVPWSETAECT